MQEEDPTEAFEKLRKSMPSIGFINRKKRIKAYIQITNIAEYMLSTEEISEDQALFILSLLMRKCADFQKAATMTALGLNSMGKGVLSPIGLKFILEIRKNLSLPKTHHSDEIIDSEEKSD
ncbi:MAG: hypothetical protein DRQ62_16465 [Gammaproteobacteria bacterium]|nr:MAG: hypothetical protein DRQ62_16465 [Gammaproteobacteria bacterium]